MLKGDFGNDTFFVDAQGEAIERTGEGTDTVRSTVSYSVAGQNLERLFLLAPDTSARGNVLDNIIVGQSGANTLNGSSGNDTLTGNGGADYFVFTTALNASTNVDTITDYQIGLDEIRLQNAVFTNLAEGCVGGEGVPRRDGSGGFLGPDHL